MRQNNVQQITRRAAITHIGKFGLLAGTFGSVAFCGLADEAVKPEFKFIVVNDTHYMSEECGGYLAGLVKQLNTEGASLCLHAGDVTDLGTAQHEEAVRGVFERLDMPFYCVPGNHDWVTPTDRSGYMSAFPQRLNYNFTHGGWQFIALDSTEGQKFEKTTLQPATFSALDEMLPRLDKQKPTVVFTHFPLCEGTKMRPLNAGELLAKFDGWNVRAIFGGHFHGFTECERGEAKVTTNRCCALKRNNHDKSKEKGYFVCEVGGGKLARRFVEYRPS